MLIERTHVQPHKGSLGCCLSHGLGILHDRGLWRGCGRILRPQPHTCLAWLSERCAWSSSSRWASSSCRSCSICTLWSSSCNHTPTPGFGSCKHPPAPLSTGAWPGWAERAQAHFAGGVCRVLGESTERATFPRAGILGAALSLGPAERKHPNPSVCIAAFSWKKW